MQRFIFALSGMLFVIAFGSLGYEMIEGWGLSRSLFFTLITITTIGYGDYGLSHAGEIFTIFVIVAGLAIYTYSLSQLIQTVATQDFMRARRMERSIKQLTDHFIICGMGRMGVAIAQHLDEIGATYVAIDQDAARVELAHEQGRLAIVGDATEDRCLLRAGIERAKAIVCTAPSDTVNIVAALSARDLRDDIPIISRAEEEDAIRKLQLAGATKIVSPISAGATRAVHAILSPHLAEILDNAISGSASVEMAEIPISESMDERWRSAGACSKEHPLVAFVAVRQADGDLCFGIDPTKRFKPGDVLIVAGAQQEVCSMAVEARTFAAAA